MPKNSGALPTTGFKSDAFAQEKPKVKAKRPFEERMVANRQELAILKQKILRHLPADKAPRIKARIESLERVLATAEPMPVA